MLMDSLLVLGAGRSYQGDCCKRAPDVHTAGYHALALKGIEHTPDL